MPVLCLCWPNSCVLTKSGRAASHSRCGGGWMIFRFSNSILFFVNWFFSYLIKCNHIMFIRRLRQRSERVESPGTYVTEWVLLGPVFFRTALPRSGGYHLERRGINCKKRRNYWKSRRRCQVFWVRGVYLMIVCVCDLAWHDCPSLVKGESHGILLLF